MDDSSRLHRVRSHATPAASELPHRMHATRSSRPASPTVPVRAMQAFLEDLSWTQSELATWHCRGRRRLAAQLRGAV
eukprot:978848-Pyramimonas_sp.AAC.1